MTDEIRPYTKRKRAEQEAQTRLRLAQAAMELHGTVGPARTSISAVAERAGVQRSTLYRHFPDESALFAACSAHWMELNPVPEIERWAAIAEPSDRLASGLAELYAFYARNEAMLANLLRDETTVEPLGRLMVGFRDYLKAVADVLMIGRSAHDADPRRLRATLGHAVAFTTWRSLVREQGLSDDEAVDLICKAVAAAE